MSVEKIEDIVTKQLQPKISKLPEGFFDTFKFTKTGKKPSRPLLRKRDKMDKVRQVELLIENFCIRLLPKSTT